MSQTPRKTSQATEASSSIVGKSYSYQAPAESAPAAGAGPDIEGEKKKVIDAFDGFLDALETRVAGTGAPPAKPAAGQGSTPPSSGGGGTTSDRPGSSPPSVGASGSGGGEQAKASESEAVIQERAVFAQREAYQLDRARELMKSRRKQETVVTAAAPAPLASGLGMHQPVSNRKPITESKDFPPSFGEQGRSNVPTMERVAALRSERPESAPASGMIHAAPIDAYFGSFGTPLEKAKARAKQEDSKLLEVILGTDDRIRVTNNQAYPWRCICSLLITANTGTQFLGTGWLVGPRLLLTAGHCVYMSDEGGWATSIEVAPGRNGNDRPYGSAIATDLRSVSGWTQDGNSDYDYGAIILPPDKRLGDQLGWFGFANRPDDYLRNITLNLSGYPGDGGPAHIDGTQWFHSRNVRDVLEKQITYEIDTFGGQSGSPVWEMTSEGNRYGVAIHTFGTSVNNGGTRINGDVYQNIIGWSGEAA